MYGLFAIFLLLSTAAAHAIAAYVARRAVTQRFTAAAAAAAAADADAAKAGAEEPPIPLLGAFLRGIAGIAAWYLASSIVFAGGLFSQGEVIVDDVTMHVTVAAGGPAARAGIQTGDRIVTAGGEPVPTWDSLRAIVGKSAGSADLPVEIERQSVMQTVHVAVPEGPAPKILVGPMVVKHDVGIGGAIVRGLSQPARVLLMQARAIVKAASPSPEKPELAGPVAIVKETSTAARTGIASALMLAAMLAAYVLPYVVLATALYEILSRRRKTAAS